MRTLSVLLLGAALLAALGLAAERTAAPAIETKLASLVGERLREAGLPSNVVSIDGRDVWVEAVAGQSNVQIDVVRALGAVPGLRVINARPVEGGGAPPRFTAEWTGSTLRLAGHLKGEGGPAERASLSDGLRRTLGSATIVNEIAIDPNVERAAWAGEIPGLLRVVWGSVRDGRMELEGLVLTVSGTVTDENTRTEIGERLSSLLPTARVRNQIAVPGGHEEVKAGIAAALARGSVEFREGTERLTETSQDVLDEMADLLIAHPDVVVRIEGYIYTGRAHEERPLSRVRAIVVKDYLMGRGVLDSRLRPIGMGSPANAGVTLDQGVESLILFLVEGGV